MLSASGVRPILMYSDAFTGMVSSARTADLPELAADLGRALGAVMARVTLSTIPATPVTSQQGGETAVLLTVEQAAERLGVARTWLYRHAASLPFTRKLGHRTLRFDAAGLQKWVAQRPRG